MIDTTNAIEALNSKLRRAVRTRGHFPGDEAAMKLLYLVLNHAAEEWKRPPREWTEAKTQFAVLFGDRFMVLMNKTGSAHKITDSPGPGCADIHLGQGFSLETGYVDADPSCQLEFTPCRRGGPYV